EHPVLLDLEALFHPRTKGTHIKHPSLPVSHRRDHSVLRVGILPQRIWSNADSEGIDLSGLGAAAGQITPFGVPQWERIGTDEMRLTRKPVAITGELNRPTLNGAEVDVLDYYEAISVGFTYIYQLLLQYRNELLSDNGPIARFAEDVVRVILRPTQTYAALLRESFHPDVLSNALERDRLFDRLWIGTEYHPH